MASYQTWREEFIRDFARYVPKGTQSDALAFLRDASGEQRFAEIATSIDVGEKEMERLERASERRTERVKARCEALGIGLETCGDPRGSPYTLIVDGRKISVPGRGLPARCFR